MVHTVHKDEELRRRTSPLVFKPIPVGDDGVMTLVLYMQGPLLPEESQLKLAARSRQKDSLEVPEANWWRSFWRGCAKDRIVQVADIQLNRGTKRDPRVEFENALEDLIKDVRRNPDHVLIITIS